MSTAAWDAERAAELARKAYRYVGEHYPPGAPLEPLARTDAAVLEAEERGAVSWRMSGVRERRV